MPSAVWICRAGGALDLDGHPRPCIVLVFVKTSGGDWPARMIFSFSPFLFLEHLKFD